MTGKCNHKCYENRIVKASIMHSMVIVFKNKTFVTENGEHMPTLNKQQIISYLRSQNLHYKIANNQLRISTTISKSQIASPLTFTTNKSDRTVRTQMSYHVDVPQRKQTVLKNYRKTLHKESVSGNFKITRTRIMYEQVCQFSSPPSSLKRIIEYIDDHYILMYHLVPTVTKAAKPSISHPSHVSPEIPIKVRSGPNSSCAIMTTNRFRYTRRKTTKLCSNSLKTYSSVKTKASCCLFLFHRKNMSIYLPGVSQSILC